MSGSAEARRAKAREVVDRLEGMYPDATTTALDHRTDFELLIATILSAQCTDKRVNMVTPALFARYPDARALALASAEEVGPFIETCGLWRSKAKNIVATARALVERHGAEVPRTREALEDLPGVGRKTASVVLAVAMDEPALAVDTHVHRVANRLGLASTKHPLDTERALTDALPREQWSTAHHRLIEHGRTICKALSPRCAECPLMDLCEFVKSL